MPTELETAFIQEVLARNLVSAYQIDQAYKTYQTLRGQGLAIQLHQVFVQLQYLTPLQVQAILEKVKQQPKPPSALEIPAALEFTGGAGQPGPSPGPSAAGRGPVATPAAPAGGVPLPPPAAASATPLATPILIAQPKSSKISWTTISAVLFLAVGVGVIFVVRWLREVQKSSDMWVTPKSSSQTSGSDRLTGPDGAAIASAGNTTTTAPQPLFPEFKNKFLSILDRERYAEAQAFLDGAPEPVKAEAGQEGFQALRDTLAEKAKAYLKRQKEKIEECRAAEHYDQAIELLSQIEATGYKEFASETQSLLESVQMLKQRSDLLKRLEAYETARMRLNPLLKERLFGKASQVIDEMVADSFMHLLKNELVETKKDFELVRKLLRHASDAAKEKIGTFIMVGGKAQKLLNVENGVLMLQQGAKVAALSEDKLSPTDVERFVRPSDKTDPETLYALGLLYSYDGKNEKASHWFDKVGDTHPGVQRQKEFRRLQIEGKAADIFKDLRAALDRKQMDTVIESARKLRALYGSSELVKIYDTWISEAVKKAEAVLPESSQKN